jgi:polysaccharide biosynthesis transport protein
MVRDERGESVPLLQWLVRLLWLRRYLVGALVLLAFVPLFLLIMSLPNHYTARSTVMIDPIDRATVEARPPPLTLLGDRAAIATEMEVLRSPALLRRLVIALDLDRPNALDSHLYGPGGETPFSLSSLVGGGVGAEEVEVRDPVTAAIERLAQQLRVRNLNESRVIEIAFSSRDPAFAAQVVNQLVELYVILQQERQISIAERGRLWLDDRLEELQARLITLERSAEVFRSRSVLALGADVDLLQSQIQETSNAVLQAEGELQRARARHSALDTAIAAGDTRAVLTALNNPALEQLLAREAEAQRQVELLADRHGADHSGLVRAREELAALRRQIELEAATRRNGLAVELELALQNLLALRVELSALQVRLTKARENDIEQRDLDRQVEVGQEVFATFLSRLQETEVIPTEITSAWVVSRAEIPLRRTRPQRAVLLAGAAGFSGAFALAAVLLLTQRSQGTLVGPEEVRRRLDIHCIAAVPTLRRGIWGRRREMDAAAIDLHEPYWKEVRKVATAALNASASESGAGHQRPVVFLPGDPRASTSHLGRSTAFLLTRSRHRTLLVEVLEDEASVLLSTDKKEENVPPLRIELSRMDGTDLLILAIPMGAVIDRRELEAAIHARSSGYDVIIVHTPDPVLAPEEVLPLRAAAVIMVHLWGSPGGQHVLDAQDRLLADEGAVVGAVLVECR